MMERKLRWGIIGTGGIARKLAEAIHQSRTGELAAVGSRRQETADAFGDEFEVPKRYPRYEELIADSEVDVVYNSLPNHLHAEWTIKCAQAGKHVLCEKPLAANVGQAMALIEAVRYHNVFMLEAFMYRCHPQTAKLAELVKEGVIGEVRLIQANFSFDMGISLENIRQQNGAAGGGIMDVGCYTMSMARLIAGAAVGEDVAEPVEVKGCAHIGAESRVDEWATASVKFPGDIVANLACGTRCGVESGVRIWGSEGSIEVPNPWFPGEGENEFVVNRKGEDPEIVVVTADLPLYAIEVDAVAEYLKARQAPYPRMTWKDSIGQQRALDMWRESIDLVFDVEAEEEALKQTVSKQPLVRRADSKMKYGRVEGIDQEVSRLVMGTMIYSPARQAFANAMLDYFFEIGGNTFDAAFVYGGGGSEVALGNWIRLRGIRDQVVVLGKAGAVSTVTPEMLEEELAVCLERLQTDYVDLFMMHRDNLEIPVGEFVDWLNGQKEAGRMRAFGGSNWTPERLQEANEYAAGKGLTGFAASSPNFALAVWNEPVWADCVRGTDEKSKEWYTKQRMPLFAWSSQAQGFFTGRYSPDDRSDESMVRCWYNEGNWQRLERARQLAAEKGVDATQIAAAYVLCQPFLTFALVGPRSFEEMRTTALGLEVELTSEEIAWLNLERDER